MNNDECLMNEDQCLMNNDEMVMKCKEYELLHEEELMWMHLPDSDNA